MMTENSLGLFSVKNARQLGGYETKDGRHVRGNVLLRSGHLADISDEDVDTLTGKYGLCDIVDFRTRFEMYGKRDPEIVGVRYHHIDIINDEILSGKSDKFAAPSNTPDGVLACVKALDDIGVFHDEMYIEFLENDIGKKGYAEFFALLLGRDSGSILWHCASGKDRTGVAAMLVLGVLGVPKKTIMTDFMDTNIYNAERIKNTQALIRDILHDGKLAENTPLFGGVTEIYMENAFAHLKKEYGGVSGYVREVLGLSAHDEEDLRRRYVV